MKKLVLLLFITLPAACFSTQNNPLDSNNSPYFSREKAERINELPPTTSSCSADTEKANAGSEALDLKDPKNYDLAPKTKPKQLTTEQQAYSIPSHQPQAVLKDAVNSLPPKTKIKQNTHHDEEK